MTACRRVASASRSAPRGRLPPVANDHSMLHVDWQLKSAAHPSAASTSSFASLGNQSRRLLKHCRFGSSLCPEEPR